MNLKACSKHTLNPLMLLLLVLLVSACDNTPEQSIMRQGLVFCSEGNPDTLNPQFATSGIAFDAGGRTLFNRLVQLEPGTSTIKPSLAESWTISEDGLRYQFTLRRDVQFHTTKYFQPSRAFNANDVLFSFNRQRLQAHPYHFVSRRSYPYFDSMGLRELIIDIKKIHNYSVEFHLARPESPFLSILAMEFASIFSAEYAQRLLEEDQQELFDLFPIGTGPFVFVRHVQDSHIRFHAHPQYYKGPEKIKYLVFAITPEPSLRYARLTAGECDVMANPLPAYLNLIHKNKTLDLYQMTGLNIGYWAFNTTKPPFDDIRVRRALNHAINRQAIIHSVYLDSAEIAESPLPPSIWSHHTELPSYTYDPVIARKLLKEAGIEQLEIDIWAFNIQRPYNPDSVKMAELIKRDLEQIDIKTNIVTLEWSSFIHRVSQGQHQTALLGWTADNEDPDHFLTPLLTCDAAMTGSNRAFWCSKDFDGHLNSARKITDPNQRADLYYQAQETFKSEAPWLTIAHATQYIAARSHVKNLKQTPSGGVYFSGVYLER
ncbi:MAG: ABC transporter substrate-binding protein [Pseudomonadota bacterium]